MSLRARKDSPGVAKVSESETTVTQILDLGFRLCVVLDGWRDGDFSPRALHLACLKAYRVRVCQCAMVADSVWWGGPSLSGLAYQVAWKFRNQMYQSLPNLQRSRGGNRLNQ